MLQHVGKLSGICFFHLRRLHQFRWRLNPSSRQRLVSVLILSRIVFCNAGLVGLTAFMLAPLKRVRNAAARFVAGLPTRTHVIDTMPVATLATGRLIAFVTRYLLMCGLYAVLNGTIQFYIADTTTRILTLPGRGRLRSANTSEFDISRTRTKV